MTNSAGNVINMVRVHQTDRPSSTVWVQLDHTGTKTRLENRQLHVQGIEITWTPNKPVTTAKTSTTNYYNCHIRNNQNDAVHLVCCSPQKRSNLQQA